jgi:hypothetical protein
LGSEFYKTDTFIMSKPIPAIEQNLGFECRIRTLEDVVKSFLYKRDPVDQRDRYYGAQMIQSK